MTHLFEPITLGSLEIKNRIWLSPMCMYACEEHDGRVGDLHLVHLGARAMGGFGLVMTEAAAVGPEGRISPTDAGIWTDTQAEAWRPVVDFCRRFGAASCIQLAHAGRKASTWRGFVGEPSGPAPAADGGWQVVGPSPVPYPGLATPRELSSTEIHAVVEAFADAAERAQRVGFDSVEVHAAHGYLIHQFLSPLSNERTDQWGGSFENRTRLILQIVAAIRERVGADFPVLVRISATDWHPEGWTPEDSERLAPLLAEAGCNLIDVSSGSNLPADIPVEPLYQVPLAERVRAAVAHTGCAVSAVGLITEPAQAEAILADGRADAVFLARAALREPAWPMRAVRELVGPALEQDGQMRAGATAWPPYYRRAER
ncbi:MAG: NADH:flavin oxidoreductase/NADH oxidase [Bowdeniella nasicola]|nr:NADH:flavin oxidoreductase/NADH oxidase [Bowdeniella nasicola]